MRRGMVVNPIGGLLCAAALVASGAGGVRAQSALDRPPNMSGGWIGAPQTVYFHFLHRFNQSGAPQRQVTNRPTFLLAYRLPLDMLLGAHYATRSDLVDRYPNEWELFARHAPFQQDYGAPLDVALQLSYNVAAESLDGEASVGRRFGPLRLLAGGRAFRAGYAGDSLRVALAGGAVLRLNQWFALAGDVASLLDHTDDERTAWGAALQIAIPYTPHSLSLQATNTNTASLQGSSRGADQRRYGFEFTVPFTLARHFGRRTTVDPPVLDPGPTGTTGPTVAAGMRNIAYTPATIEITAGTTIVWTNNDPVEHTVTAADRSFDSGMIPPGGTWRRRFDTPGTYPFLCTPHPFMTGTVVVRPAD